MNLIRIAITITFCFLIPKIGSSQENSTESRVLNVSFIDLMVRPQELPEGYNQISVVGYLTEAFGALGLFLSAGHAELLDQTSAMVIELPSAEFRSSGCLDSYVRVTGFFRQQPLGFLPTIVKLMKVESRHEDVGLFLAMPDEVETELDREKVKKPEMRHIPAPCWERGKE